MTSSEEIAEYRNIVPGKYLFDNKDIYNHRQIIAGLSNLRDRLGRPTRTASMQFAGHCESIPLTACDSIREVLMKNLHIPHAIDVRPETIPCNNALLVMNKFGHNIDCNEDESPGWWYRAK
jgi:hypothetical protein